MLEINTIKKGIVIDHIRAGAGIKIFNYLKLDKADYTVALIMNAASAKMGKKDIIKIENTMDIDFTVLGMIDPNLTINIVDNDKIIKKMKLDLPEKVVDVVKCKNPRCITTVENEIKHIFYLADREKGEYRCYYCDELISY